MLAITGCALDDREPSTPSTGETADSVVSTAPRAIPGRVEAEDYNAGGEGVGFHDVTAKNSGGAYRSDAVDIEPSSDTGGGFDVGWIAAGEFLVYDLEAAKAGDYAFSARVASGSTGTKSFHLVVDGAPLPAVSFPATGGWQTWISVAAGSVRLGPGAHQLRVELETSGMNFNFLDVTLTRTMLVGAAAKEHDGRANAADELAFLEANVGRLDLHRVYDSGFDHDFMTRGGIDVGKRATHYSFKPDMTQLAAGALDGAIRGFLATIPAGHRTILTIWHEPEDNFTTAEQKATYRAAWQRFSQLVREARRAELSTSWVMMAFSWNLASGRNPNDWWPGDGVVDSVGIDAYNEGSLNGTRWDSPGRSHGLAAPGDVDHNHYFEGGTIAWINAKHARWGIAEWGSLENTNHVAAGWTTTPTKAAWLMAAATFYRDQGADYIEYFHSGPNRGPWWLDSSQAALDAYRQIVATF